MSTGDSELSVLQVKQLDYEEDRTPVPMQRYGQNRYILWQLVILERQQNSMMAVHDTCTGLLSGQHPPPNTIDAISPPNCTCWQIAPLPYLPRVMQVHESMLVAI